MQLAQQLIASGSTPSEHVAKHELARRVRQAIARLADIDREILLMRNFERLSYGEIAYVLQIDPAAARKRHGRALLRLNKILREKGLKES
jgi:RNA polymerase sigma-70 factor (ECF subfamily)